MTAANDRDTRDNPQRSTVEVVGITFPKIVIDDLRNACVALDMSLSQHITKLARSWLRAQERERGRPFPSRGTRALKRGRPPTKLAPSE